MATDDLRMNDDSPLDDSLIKPLDVTLLEPLGDVVFEPLGELMSLFAEHDAQVKELLSGIEPLDPDMFAELEAFSKEFSADVDARVKDLLAADDGEV